MFKRSSAEILEAASRLLAGADYDRVSMAAIARAAKTSTGVLYCRFADKEALLGQLAADTFYRLTENAKHRSETNQFTDYVPMIRQTIEDMTAPKVAGVVRATVKLGMTRPSVLKPFNEYRKTCADLMVKAIGEAETRVRAATQAVLATITDSIVVETKNPMRAPDMARALSELFEGYVFEGNADD